MMCEQFRFTHALGIQINHSYILAIRFRACYRFCLSLPAIEMSSKMYIEFFVCQETLFATCKGKEKTFLHPACAYRLRDQRHKFTVLLLGGSHKWNNGHHVHIRSILKGTTLNLLPTSSQTSNKHNEINAQTGVWRTKNCVCYYLINYHYVSRFLSQTRFPGTFVINPCARLLNSLWRSGGNEPDVCVAKTIYNVSLVCRLFILLSVYVMIRIIKHTIFIMWR